MNFLRSGSVFGGEGIGEDPGDDNEEKSFQMNFVDSSKEENSSSSSEEDSNPEGLEQTESPSRMTSEDSSLARAKDKLDFLSTLTSRS